MKQVIFFFISFVVLIGCQESIVDPPQNNSEGVVLSIDMGSAPDDVVALEGLLTREGHDSVYFTFTIDGNTAQATVMGLVSGDWTLKVDALDKDGNILYSGSTKVQVVAGKVTPVYLQLNPVTGGLSIIVTWGDGELLGKILFMAKDSSNIWKILSMDISGENFLVLGDGTYPIWTGKDSFIIYRKGTRSIERINFVTGNVDYLGSTPQLINFLRYSKEKNVLVFDYYENKGIWHIGYMNLDGSGFTPVVVDQSYKKRPVPVGDWIYYMGNASGKNQIYKVRFDGSDLQQITNGPKESGFPSFDLLGKKMIYGSKDDNGFYLNEMDIQSNVIKSFSFSNEVIYPVYSTSGSYIIYVEVVGPSYSDRKIFRMDADGNNKEDITPSADLTEWARPLTW